MSCNCRKRLGVFHLRDSMGNKSTFTVRMSENGALSYSLVSYGQISLSTGNLGADEPPPAFGWPDNEKRSLNEVHVWLIDHVKGYSVHMIESPR